MKNYILAGLFVLTANYCFAGDFKEVRLRMSLQDEFILQETDDIKIEVQELVMLRYANLKIQPRKMYTYDMMLYFKCDTKDLSQYNSPSKIASSVLKTTLHYMPYVVEKEIDLKEANWNGQYGFYTILTDAKLINETTLPKGQFKYVTLGMVRLSEDSVLGFSVFTNKVLDQSHSDLLTYIKGFIK